MGCSVRLGGVWCRAGAWAACSSATCAALASSYMLLMPQQVCQTVRTCSERRHNVKQAMSIAQSWRLVSGMILMRLCCNKAWMMHFSYIPVQLLSALQFVRSHFMYIRAVLNPSSLKLSPGWFLHGIWGPSLPTVPFQQANECVCR